MKRSNPLLIRAVFKNDIAELVKLLAQDVPVDETDADGRTALHHAVINEQPAFVAKLLESGADCNRADNEGWVPLHFAVRNKSVRIAELLIANGADINAADNHGNSVLARAVFESRGRGEFIVLLRKAGADKDQRNKYGVSALELANTINNYDIKKWFG